MYQLYHIIIDFFKDNNCVDEHGHKIVTFSDFQKMV